ncbi:MAG: DUF4157 domain-containing protein [Duganella sp.]
MSDHAERQPAKAGSNQPTTQRQMQPSGQTERMQQLADHSPQALQLKQQTEAIAPPNRTGLPDQLKSGIESLSGMSMDHVKVHYNSSKPAQLQAHAYAQGSDIHVGPGQERHLPHEAWHVVQQAQGRVRPTIQMACMAPVNDDQSLEREADVMGGSAAALGTLQAYANPDPMTRVENKGAVSKLSNYRSDAITQSKLKKLADDTPQATQLRAIKNMISGDAEASVGSGCMEPIQMVRNFDAQQYAVEIEQLTRRDIPRAGNQIPDLIADADTLSRHELTRYMNQSVLGADPGGTDIGRDLRHTLGTAMGAQRYRGGMCNEYSAVSFAHHMASPSVSGEPIVRFWNPGMGHSFTTVGDERDPTMPRFVADGWTMNRDPVLASDSVMAVGTNNVVAEWTDRMPGEGRVRVEAAHAEAAALFNAAERDPARQNQYTQIFNINRQNQQDSLTQLRNGIRPTWMWNHRTNRRQP